MQSPAFLHLPPTGSSSPRPLQKSPYRQVRRQDSLPSRCIRISAGRNAPPETDFRPRLHSCPACPLPRYGMLFYNDHKSPLPGKAAEHGWSLPRPFFRPCAAYLWPLMRCHKRNPEEAGAFPHPHGNSPLPSHTPSPTSCRIPGKFLEEAYLLPSWQDEADTGY